MKKSLLILMAAVAVVGCKKNTNDPQTDVPANPEAITIGAMLNVENSSKATLPTVFGVGSQIGMYEAFVKADKSFDAFRKDNLVTPGSEVYNENLQYEFGTSVTSVWNNVGAQKILTWAYTNDDKLQGDKKIYLVGYHPFGVVKFDRNEFNLAKDQTSIDSLKKADLMWAMTAGTFVDTDDNNIVKFNQLAPGYALADIKGEGLTKTKHSSKAVDMMFHHMLSKQSYKVRFVKPKGATEGFDNPEISKIKLLGPEITVKGKLDLAKGVFTADANAAGVAPEIVWAPALPVKYKAENGDPIVVKESDATAVAADYLYCSDLIAQPADFTGTVYNYIEFHIAYDYTSADATVKEKRSQTYRFQLGKTVDFMKFERNKQYNIIAAIELNTNNIFVTTQIAPWVDVNPGEIQPN